MNKYETLDKYQEKTYPECEMEQSFHDQATLVYIVADKSKLGTKNGATLTSILRLGRATESLSRPREKLEKDAPFKGSKQKIFR